MRSARGRRGAAPARAPSNSEVAPAPSAAARTPRHPPLLSSRKILPRLRQMFPWCSWLSRQPNMLKVRGSNPCGVTFCVLVLVLVFWGVCVCVLVLVCFGVFWCFGVGVLSFSLFLYLQTWQLREVHCSLLAREEADLSTHVRPFTHLTSGSRSTRKVETHAQKALLDARSCV